MRKMDWEERTLSLKKLVHTTLLFGAILVSLPATNADGTVRLRNDIGSATYKGRVEVFYGDAWGTICDDNWSIADADVICRQLGFTGAIQALPRAYYGAGNNLIWLDDVRCNGDEERIQDCPNAGWGVHDCLHIEDASVECSTATVRMVEGPDRYEGNVQVLHEDEWGYVCDEEWDYEDAKVACNQLDQRGVDAVRMDSHYGTDPGTIWLEDLECDGTELTLEQCPHSEWNDTEDCTLNDKAGVMCTKDATEDGAVRLVGTSDPYRGRVEIFHDGQWGTVCDDFWDYYDAKVVCRQLGYEDSQAKAYIHAYYGQGSGPIWKDNVGCYGTEERLEDCVTSYGWGQHDCTHSEDAGVYCDLKGVFDAGEITGIVLASLIGFGIFLCCIKFIFFGAAYNKSESRRNRRRRRSRGTTNNTTTPTDPEEHFNTHFNSAYTISDNQEEIFTPPGFFPPPFPGEAPYGSGEQVPYGNGELPPAYDVIFSKGGPMVAANPANPLDTGTVNLAPAGAGYGACAATGAANGATGGANANIPQYQDVSGVAGYGASPAIGAVDGATGGATLDNHEYTDIVNQVAGACAATGAADGATGSATHTENPTYTGSVDLLPPVAPSGVTHADNPTYIGRVDLPSVGAGYGAGVDTTGSQPMPTASGSNNPYPPPERKTSENSTHGQPSALAASASFTPVENANATFAASVVPPYPPAQTSLPYPPITPYPDFPPEMSTNQSNAVAPCAVADPAVTTTDEPVRSTAELATASISQAGESTEPVGTTAVPVAATANPTSVIKDLSVAAPVASDIPTDGGAINK